MKKLMKLFILTILLLFNINVVKAADFSTSISGSTGITIGGTVTVTFKANSSAKLLGLKATLNYDTDKLELVSSSAGSGFNLTLGKSIVVDSTSGKSGLFTYATIKFKAKDNFKLGETTTISVSNISGSDGTKTYSGSTSKLTLKMKSTDNTLKNLSVDSKTVANFKDTTLSYKMTVENNVSKINISAVANDSKASLKGTGTKNLDVYSNSFKIVVTSESGSSKTYTLTVIRKDENGYTSKRSTNNTLKSLEIENYELDFDSSINEYALKVNNEVETLKITAIPNDTSAKVEINNPKLEIGLNKISIKVTAEDGSVNEYIINVTRSNDNPQITIDKFKETSEITTKETIEVLVKKDQVITKSELEMIKSSSKNVIFSYYENNKLVYAWHLLNKDILTNENFDTTIEYKNEYQKEFEKLTNYAENISFTIINKNKSKAKLKLVVDSENNKSNLYYYDKALKLQEEIEIVNNYVEIPVLHENYFISRTNLKTESFNVWPLILAIENVLLAALCVFLYFRKRRNVVVKTENEIQNTQIS